MPDKSRAITLLRVLGALLPGNYLKTAVYLHAVVKPRRALRLALGRFYRMDHVYDVLREARERYDGNLSILEFGTNEGYAFRKILYATKYTKMSEKVTVHGFDTFEGMPAPEDRRDINVITDREEWVQQQFRGGYEKLDRYCRGRYPNYRLHKGTFEKTLTDELLTSLAESLPILVWVDCDFYSSARTVMERLIPVLPSGCVVYFDEFEFNYGSRFTGEARLVHEINHGMFGEGIELVLDRAQSLDTRRVYRFIRYEGGPHYRIRGVPERDPGRSPTNDSPLP